MPQLVARLKPFYGSASLTLTPAMQAVCKSLKIPFKKGGLLPLYIFDLKAKKYVEIVDDVREQAGPGDHAIFALVNPSFEEVELEDMITVDHSGFLMVARDEAQIFRGKGKLDTFATDVDAFVKALKKTNEDEDEGDGDDDDDDD